MNSREETVRMAKKKARNGGHLGGVESFHVRQANSLFDLATAAAEESRAEHNCTSASDQLQHARYLYGQATAHEDSITVEAARRVSWNIRSRAAGAIQSAQRDLGACLKQSRGR